MRANTEGFSVSFLDLLSCGLGGGIFIFVIFSTLQHQGSDNSTASQGSIGDASVVAPENAPVIGAAAYPVLYRVRIKRVSSLDIVTVTNIDNIDVLQEPDIAGGAYLVYGANNERHRITVNHEGCMPEITIEPLSGIQKTNEVSFVATRMGKSTLVFDKVGFSAESGGLSLFQ